MVEDDGSGVDDGAVEVRVSDEYSELVLGIPADEFRKVKKADLGKASEILTSATGRWQETRGLLKYKIVNDEEKGPHLLMLGKAPEQD